MRAVIALSPIQFKKYLHNIVKRQLVAAKPPTSLAAGGAAATAAAGQKKGKGKGAARLHYVYIPTVSTHLTLSAGY